jgi:hypothetical protein
MAETRGTKPKKAKPGKAPAKKAKAKAKGAKSAGVRKAAKRPGRNGAKARNGASATGDGRGAAAKASSNGSGDGGTLGTVVDKAKLPLLATGAVVAGAAAVIATKGAAGGRKQHKLLGVPVPKRSKSHLPKVSVPKVGVPKVGLPKGKGLKGDVRRAAGALTDAAGKADEIGKRISRVASSVQAVGSATDDAAKKS